MPFDVSGARREGYSDKEIASFLASQYRFDLEGARKEGYGDGDIIAYLSRPAPPTAEEVAQAERPARMTLSRGGQPEFEAETTQTNTGLGPDAMPDLLGQWASLLKPANATPKPDRRFEAANAAGRQMIARQNRVGTSVELAEMAKMDVANEVASTDFWRGVGASLQSVPADWKQIMGGALRLAGEALPDEQPGRASTGGWNAAKREMTAIGADFYDQGSREIAEAHRGLKPEFGTQAVGSAVRSLGAMLPILATGGLTGSPAVVIGLMSGETGAKSYGEARDQGLNPGQAAVYATLQAVIEGGTEYLPIKALFRRDLTAGRQFLNFMVREVPSEEAATVLQAAVDKVSLRPDMTMRELINDMAVTAVSTPLAGAGQVGAVRAMRAAQSDPAARSEAQTAVTVAQINRAQSVDEAISIALRSQAGDEARSAAEEAIASLPKAAVEAPPLQPQAVEPIAPPSIARVPAVGPGMATGTPAAGGAIGLPTEVGLDDTMGGRLPEASALPVAPAPALQEQRSAEGLVPAEGSAEAAPDAAESTPASVPGLLEPVRIFGKPVAELSDAELRVAARHAGAVEQREAAADEIVRRSQVEPTPAVAEEPAPAETAPAAASTETAPKTAMQIAFERAQAALPEREATPAAEGKGAAIPGVPEVVYRGIGREGKAAVYGSVAIPILGEGRYFAFSEQQAQRFGPNVEARAIRAQRPLVVDSDAKWRALTKEAGWEVPNPSGLPEDRVRGMVNSLQEVLHKADHDAVAVTWPENYRGDILPDGRGIKLLRNVFDVPQVFVPEAAPRAAGEMPYIRGVPAEDVPLRQLEAMAKAGNPEIKAAAQVELRRRGATPGPETSRGAVQTEDVRLFGKPLADLTDQELAVSARAHRMSAFREAARQEIARRAQAHDVRQATSEFAPSVEGVPQATARTPAAASTPAPILILGKAPEQVAQRTLELVTKAGNPALKAAARAELDRRGQAVGRPSTALRTQPADLAEGKAGARSEVPSLVPPRASENALDAASEADQATERPAVGILMTPPYTGVATEDGTATDAGSATNAKSARPDAIRQAVRDLFRVPINEGGFKGSRDKVGIYKVKPQTIRVRNQNDIGVIAHETGHHFSETSRPVRELMKAHEGELRKITPYAAGQKTAALQREEGFAEYLRLRWTQPAQAKAKAPGFTAAFEQYVDDNGHRAAFDQIEGAIDNWQNLPPAERILAKVGDERPDFRKRVNLDRIIFEVFDRWLPMQRMVEDLKPDIAPSADPFKLAHLLSGDAAIVEDYLLRETIPFDFKRRANVEDRGQPLADILKPIEDHEREFGAYLIAKRANELMRRGKEHLYSADEIAAGLRLETPEFKKAAEAIYQYQDELLQYAVEGGLLSPYVADKFRQFPFYVPFFRVGEPIGQRGDIFKQIRGGTENLRDPIANIIENTVRVIHATNRNFVIAKAHDLARTVPGGGRWLEDVPMPERAVKLQTQKIIEQLREQGIAIDTETAEAIATTQTFFVKNPFGDERERIIVTRRSGKPRALQVNDDMLWHALERFEPVDMGVLEQVLSVPADILRAGIVFSPEFMARNFARDTLSGFIQSKTGMLPVAGTVNGFKEILTRSDAARLYRAFGGAYGDMWRADHGQERVLVERMARHGGFDPRTIVTPRGLLSLLMRLGSLTEAGTRVGEFKRTMRDGDIDSLIDAAYNAREVSVDFGMHGHSRTVRFLTRIVPFMNPALQGNFKAARTVKTQPLATVFRGGMLTLASVLLFLNNRDKDWYEEIEQWEKNTYWHMDIGLRDPEGQVIPIRLPKPFEWGGFFGSIPEALAEVSIKQQGEKFAKRLQSIVDDVFTFRVLPSAIVLPAELWANRNQFTGRPIVPESKERLAPELQSTPGTSLAAKKAGALMDASPAKIDHAVRGLFGTLGTYTVMLADQALRLDESEPRSLPIPWQRAPLVKVFFHDPSGANSQQVTEFYELLRDARRAEQSLKYLPPERMDEYYRRHQREIDQARSAEKVSRFMARLRKDNEGIRQDHDLPDTERVKIITENNRAIRWLARDYMKDQERAASGAR